MNVSDAAIAFVLVNEGSATTNNVSDLGGLTKWGVTLKFYQSCLGPQASAQALQAMGQAQATEFYRQFVWQQLGLNETDNLGVAAAILDAAVLCGQRHAVLTLQDCVGVAVDGKIGPLTLAAMRKADAPSLRVAYANAQVKYFNAIAQRDATQRKWLYGWLCRAVRPLSSFA